MELRIVEDAGQRTGSCLIQEVSEKSAGSNFFMLCHQCMPALS